MSLSQLILESRANGTAKRGRPKRLWIDDIKTTDKCHCNEQKAMAKLGTKQRGRKVMFNVIPLGMPTCIPAGFSRRLGYQMVSQGYRIVKVVVGVGYRRYRGPSGKSVLIVTNIQRFFYTYDSLQLYST